ncbi:TIMELESS-interacting protein [Vanessa tameamea]|uniref:TIMELESS-interacting protein n=1 Tax=Vanessa tameamea TaxID=334116 RepID=A0ABM4ATY6_VANTA
MSLLEDVFLQDEANEAQELERVIEGDEFEERPRSDSDENSEKEDEAEEDKRRVDPTTTKTRRVIKNPRFVLNPARLMGPRGIQVIPDHFKDFKFKGKGHEKEDLDLVLKKLEHWAYRLYPKFQFEDCLKKIETLGKKRPVMVHLHKIRTDQYLTEETVVQKDSSDEEAPPEDEFDKLLQQQIELARSTPAPGSVKKVPISPIKENRSLIMPKATSSPSISEEQRERMLKNRKLAEERRLARLKNLSNAHINVAESQSTEVIETANLQNGNDNTENMNINPLTDDIVEVNTEIPIRRHNRSNVIDSSDEDEIMTVNESITADVHIHRPIDHGPRKVNSITTEKAQDNDIVTEDIEQVPENSHTENTNTLKHDLIESGNNDSENVTKNDNSKDKLEKTPSCNKNDDNDIITEMIEEVPVESRISHSDIVETDIQETDNINQIMNLTDSKNFVSVEDQVNILNQETVVNHKDDVEIIEDLMDVDFSDDF